ncbi:copper chaperone PCu(A)C [Nocardioides hungaricus]
MMQLRRSSRVLAAAGALTLATVLSSCGFDYATDRQYTPAAGANDRDARVDVLGATVVSAQEGSGTFVASFANNVTDAAATVESMTVETIPSGDEKPLPLEVAKFSPIEIPAGGLVNLAQAGGVVVTGDLTAGDFVNLTIGLGDGGSVEMEVPVMPSCNEWAGLDESGDGAAAGEDQCAVESPAGEE